MTRLPPLDAHAHVDVDLSPGDAAALPAVIFAMTRSLDEARLATARTDDRLIWGVGCHPGVASAQAEFDPDEFSALIAQRPLVGELGLDGTSVVPLEVQRTTLRAALGHLQETPRLISLHSHRAQRDLLTELERTPTPGVILHWWTGSADLTRTAVDLGCYFSVNAAMVMRPRAIDGVPADRLLTETDHPYGDRRSPLPRVPGGVEPVEAALARREATSETAIRRLVWRNLRDLTRSVGVGSLLPRAARGAMASV